ncbi:spore cortex biosynthesis protein YabQ [Thermobacillus composti KWC4]|uniref:Spore cortex biosynthesis protein YabQ n=1 Tax=Thermobacillus composti (strain DSM 18247 / JCM 13945 / KWC4) TaxID=717605 RepID=L0EIR7_THECK|nr:spore cortex biosynthesis protein YabQ [Thermobacillus composti]AGA59712.1 spore cortex biosynthesis protein YabQ [Thermobacillus composti KWC4]
MSLQVQFLTLAYVALAGIGMGAAFDGYRVAARELNAGRLWIPVFDLLYWLLATLVVFRVLLAVNEGEVRLPVFLGFFIGLAFYFWLLSGPVIRLYRLLAAAVRRLWRLAVGTADVLVVRPLRWLVRLSNGFFRLVSGASMYLFRFMVQLLNPILGLVARLARPVWLPISKTAARWAKAAGLAPLTERLAAMIRNWRNRRS